MKVGVYNINRFRSYGGRVCNMNSTRFSPPSLLLYLSLFSNLFYFLLLLIYLKVRIVLIIISSIMATIWLFLALLIRLNSLLECCILRLWGWVLIKPFEVILAWLLFDITLWARIFSITLFLSSNCMKLAVSSLNV